MTNQHKHASHPTMISRLKRAHGHLRSVIEMIEDGKPCLAVAQQLQAVEKAIGNAKKTLIHDHLDHCIDAEGSDADRAELRAISKFL